jgi:hypothetical protein
MFPGSEYVVTVDLNNYLEIIKGQYEVTLAIKEYSTGLRTSTDIVSKAEVISEGKHRFVCKLTIYFNKLNKRTFGLCVEVSAAHSA